MSALILSLLFPLVLLALLLAMEHVERPLRQGTGTVDLDRFLESAQPEEVEAFISEGYGPALERYWKRRRLTSRIPGLSR